jgi:hypothetical protein
LNSIEEEPSVLINLNDKNYIDENNNEIKSTTTNNSFFHFNGPVSTRQVKFIVIPFGIRLLLTGLIWDHFVNNYQLLLQNYTDNILHRVCCCCC